MPAKNIKQSVRKIMPAPCEGHYQAKLAHKNCQDPKEYMPWWHELVAWPTGIEAWVVLFTGVGITWQALETRKAANAGIGGTMMLMTKERARIQVEFDDGNFVHPQQWKGFAGPLPLIFRVKVSNEGLTKALGVTLYLSAIVTEDFLVQ